MPASSATSSRRSARPGTVAAHTTASTPTPQVQPTSTTPASRVRRWRSHNAVIASAMVSQPRPMINGIAIGHLPPSAALGTARA